MGRVITGGPLMASFCFHQPIALPQRSAGVVRLCPHIFTRSEASNSPSISFLATYLILELSTCRLVEPQAVTGKERKDMQGQAWYELVTVSPRQ